MIQQGAVDSYKLELVLGVHVWGTDVFKIALYTADADVNPGTTAYTATNEVVASGYVAGGQTLTLITPAAVGDGIAFWSFQNLSWTAALTARAALIYNASKGNKAVAVLDFGADKTSRTTFTIQFPAATATTALLRVA